MVIAGGVLCVALITCLAGGPMIAVAKKKSQMQNEKSPI